MRAMVACLHSLLLLEVTWILENKEHIVWVVGHRVDDRCKVMDGTEMALRIVVSTSP